MNVYAGKMVITDINLTETIEDWSKVRSFSRAKRRMKKGYKQNIIFRFIPMDSIYETKDCYIMHPVIWEKLRRLNEETKIIDGGYENGSPLIDQGSTYYSINPGS